VTPLDVFNPANLSDASRLTGPAGVRALLDAARSFPGGPAVLVFALFWSPVGPGIPAGVLLARHRGSATCRGEAPLGDQLHSASRHAAADQKARCADV
jgi:ABC-type phosphate/phosphonate transport system permease subunit